MTLGNSTRPGSLTQWLVFAGSLALGLWQPTTASALPIRFLVAEYLGQRVHHDSFVVMIDDAETELLSHARALAAWAEQGMPQEGGPDSRIVFMPIAPGADGINRNHVQEGAPAWSWHQSGTVSFGDLGIELIDGWPSYVEQDVAGWMANTNGQIGFWNYTVVRELGPVPEPQTAPLVGMILFWGACATRRLSKSKRALGRPSSLG